MIASPAFSALAYGKELDLAFHGQPLSVLGGLDRQHGCDEALPVVGGSEPHQQALRDQTPEVDRRGCQRGLPEGQHAEHHHHHRGQRGPVSGEQVLLVRVRDGGLGLDGLVEPVPDAVLLLLALGEVPELRPQGGDVIAGPS